DAANHVDRRAPSDARSLPHCVRRPTLRYSNFFLPAHGPPAYLHLSLHDALPICTTGRTATATCGSSTTGCPVTPGTCPRSRARTDRKSTRLNSSHVASSYAVFCLKKKRKSAHSTPLHFTTSLLISPLHVYFMSYV